MATTTTSVADLVDVLEGSDEPALRPRGGGGDPATVVTSVTHDSRRVAAGSLFCCIPGATTDGHDHAASAVAAGAAALLVQRPVPVDAPFIEVADVRRAAGPVSDAVYGRPSADLRVVGVTGTNGKTTTTVLLGAVFREAGWPAAVLGTLSGSRTTPEAPDLQAWLAHRRDEGTAAVAMEVSSHGLELRRVDGTRFGVAVFTNLSRDHLDFHRTMERYFAAKARLFTPALARQGVVNRDDAWGRRLLDQAEIPCTSYGLDDALDLRVGADGASFRWRDQPVSLGLGGRFNVMNALAAATAAVSLGLDPAVIAAGLSRPVVVPGRFEPVDEGQPFSVVVDFAHTPDALEQLLVAAREIAGPGRLHVVFGCGGDRDPSKREPMGEVAGRLADRVVLTSDNSRGEDTGAIIDTVRAGYERAIVLPGARARQLVVEPDRRRAIRVALDDARPGDVVLLAGKGHETTQATGGSVVDFDDREVARQELRQRATVRHPDPGTGQDRTA